MKRMPIGAFIIGLCALWLLLGGAFVVPSARATSYRSDRVITGELVILNGSESRFRIVGHDGTFAAPRGVSLADFDGKAVEVELSGDQVVEIKPEPIQIQPVTHGMETVSGEFVVGDAVNRTFTIAGDNHTYVAPMGIDIRPYAGHPVVVTLDEVGDVTAIELTNAPIAPGQSMGCSFGGEGYSDGAILCQSGTSYRCEAGSWRSLGSACAGAVEPQPCEKDGVNFSQGETRCDGGTQYLCQDGTWRRLSTRCTQRTSSLPQTDECILSDATLARGSSICRQGTTYRCSSGDWVNVGVACR